MTEQSQENRPGAVAQGPGWDPPAATDEGEGKDEGKDEGREDTKAKVGDPGFQPIEVEHDPNKVHRTSAPPPASQSGQGPAQ